MDHFENTDTREDAYYLGVSNLLGYLENTGKITPQERGTLYSAMKDETEALAAQEAPCCPECDGENLGVVQTDGTISLFDGLEGGGYYDFTGDTVDAGGTRPPYNDELKDDIDEEGRALVSCQDCGHEWRDEPRGE